MGVIPSPVSGAVEKGKVSDRKVDHTVVILSHVISHAHSIKLEHHISEIQQHISIQLSKVPLKTHSRNGIVFWILSHQKNSKCNPLKFKQGVNTSYGSKHNFDIIPEETPIHFIPGRCIQCQQDCQKL